MPELPEVETIVRQLREQAIGKKIWSIEVKWSKSVKSSVDDVKRIQGSRIINVLRFGKFIVLALNNKFRMVIHLRMTGRLMWHVEKCREKYVRAIINFSDASTLYFSDTRKFGRVWICTEADFRSFTGISRLGLEPVDDSFSFDLFYDLFRGRKGILKNNLLRQDLVAGIGNIYADEICYRSGVLPTARLENISKATYKKIYDSVRKCLDDGIRHCGVSVSDFVGTRGDLGSHQNYLKVYGRSGDKCRGCSRLIVKTRVAGRGTYYCSNCQKAVV